MASSEGDIKRRIGLAMGIMQKLNSIWKSSEITTLTKLELYRVLVLSIATYGCEIWTLKKKDEQRLLIFEMACLRKIRGVTRLDKIRNTAIREALNFHISIVNRVHVKQLTYFGHVKRMPSYRYPKITLEGIIPGKRPRGRPPPCVGWITSRPTATSWDCIQSSRQDGSHKIELYGNSWWQGSYLQNLLAMFWEDSFKSSKSISHHFDFGQNLKKNTFQRNFSMKVGSK